MENHGALVGWTHFESGGRIMLRLESLRESDAASPREPDLFRVLMTKQQALLLGTYLIEQSGERPPQPRQRSRFRRLFG